MGVCCRLYSLVWFFLHLDVLSHVWSIFWCCAPSTHLCKISLIFFRLQSPQWCRRTPSPGWGGFPCGKEEMLSTCMVNFPWRRSNFFAIWCTAKIGPRNPLLSALVEFRNSGSPSTGSDPLIFVSDLTLWVGSTIHALVPCLFFTNPSKAPCNVSSLIADAISSRFPWIWQDGFVVLLIASAFLFTIFSFGCLVRTFAALELLNM